MQVARPLTWILLATGVVLGAVIVTGDETLTSGWETPREPRRLEQQVAAGDIRLIGSRVIDPAARPAAAASAPVDAPSSAPTDASSPAVPGVIPALHGGTGDGGATVASSPATPAASAPSASPAAAVAGAGNCIEIGPMTPDISRKVLIEVQRRFPQVKSEIVDRVETLRWWLHYPPQPTLADAEKKVNQLKRAGIFGATVLKDDPDYPLAVNLGAFRTREDAESYLAELRKHGVRTAAIAERPTSVPRNWVQLRNYTEPLVEQFQAIVARNPERRLQDCRG